MIHVKVDDEKFNQYNVAIPIEFIKDNTDLLNDIVVGQPVEVLCNLKSNAYKDRIFLSFAGWKITVTSGGQTQPQRQPQGRQEQPKATTAKEGNDDLPF